MYFLSVLSPLRRESTNLTLGNDNGDDILMVVVVVVN